jgi:tRNA-Thr(GGU) m(6)t(6)A37 methyltransferase TsaA
VPDVSKHDLLVRPIAWVESSLRRREDAPKQGDEGAPEACLVFEPAVADALAGLRGGDQVIVVTWLHRADRSVLRVRPRGDQTRPETGVFATRAPDRPNPIGLHRVDILAIDGLRVRVRPLEALHGTPVIDVKPVLGPTEQR